jgi:hypothetical protein
MVECAEKTMGALFMKQHNSMESIILDEFAEKYPTPDLQRKRIKELVNQFGTLSTTEQKFSVGNILCLAKMLYEAGDKRAVRDIQRTIFDLEDDHETEEKYMASLDNLKRCLTNFKPAIFTSIRDHFAKKYNIDPKLIQCFPKLVGAQVGAIAKVKKQPDDTNPMTFFVKTHQQFSSKNHSQFLSVTSDGTGKVNFKELFIYKVLEYLGYGPKADFIIDKASLSSKLDEGVLIATQDLSYTEKPLKRKNSFHTFDEIREELERSSVKNIKENTKIDIIIIDMLSRAFLLNDVMINQGNFGRVREKAILSEKKEAILQSQWKVLDFIAPELRDDFDNYSYSAHYPSGYDIFHSFKIGNASHSYKRDGLKIINQMLSRKNAQHLWLSSIDKLSSTTESRLSVPDALNRALNDIESFMNKNTKILNIKKERLAERMTDLKMYKSSIMQNFLVLEKGVRKHVKENAIKREEKNDITASTTSSSYLFTKEDWPKNIKNNRGESPRHEK